MTIKRQYSFNVGDRIAERPKLHALLAVRQESLAIVQRNSSQRYGTVVGHATKINKRGQRIKFLLIQWDHLKSPMEHAQHRICPIDQLAELTKNISVPGE